MDAVLHQEGDLILSSSSWQVALFPSSHGTHLLRPFGGTKCTLDAFFSFYNTPQDGTSLRLYYSDAVPVTTIMALS